MIDKSNSVHVLRTTKYIELVENHLRKDAVEKMLDHLKEVHAKAYKLLKSMKISWTKMNLNISKVPQPNKQYQQCNF